MNQKQIISSQDDARLAENFPEPSGPRNARGIPNFCFKSPIGWMQVIGESSCISRLSFDDIPPLTTPEIPDVPILSNAYDILTRYFAGEKVDFYPVPLTLCGGTEFQIAVWNTIREIPYGETRTYKWVAEQIGKPKAVRAVGGAVGANPISILIPCHRVIGSNGKLGGYGGGIERKRLLLQLEGYPVETLK